MTCKRNLIGIARIAAGGVDEPCTFENAQAIVAAAFFRPHRWSSNVKVVVKDLPTLTFGRSKGLGFDRVVIYPTEKMMTWLEDPKGQLEGEARAKLYVALTRARHVVAVVHDLPEDKEIPGFLLFQ